MDQILAHTDGAPLFIEELTKMVLEGGLLRERDGNWVLGVLPPPLAIPTTLQASTLRRTGVISTRTEIPPVDSIMAIQDFWNSIFQFRRKESHANNCST